MLVVTVCVCVCLRRERTNTSIAFGHVAQVLAEEVSEVGTSINLEIRVGYPLPDQAVTSDQADGDNASTA